jgi:FtsP/CotA-like multicopper oxidase with cupredoxin domain
LCRWSEFNLKKKEEFMYRQKMLIIMGLVAALATLFGGITPAGWAAPVTAPGTTPDYFETPNWANSPPLTKFVDALPTLCSAGSNSLGQCIPVAAADTASYNDTADYYEIELGEYTERMHTELPATKLRGYRQTNVAPPANQFHYLGPLIIATKDRPVRIKFTNAIPANSKLFLPVDTSIMGSGEFMVDYNIETLVSAPVNSGMFSENRGTLHLHGGRTPWISDGTPHQWTAPVGETTTYPKGISVEYVPDMWFDSSGVHITNTSYPGSNCAGNTTCGVAGATNNPGVGSLTFYYTNQQSARLMFYHDHSMGITRLNVYAGEAAGYLITDPTEQALQAAGTIPPMADTIPLIIQDKTFVNPATITTTDPTWAWGSVAPTFVTNPTVSGQGMNPVLGDLWWPHVYMTAQNPFAPDMSGANPLGRWHYGPWFNPPTLLCGSGPDIVTPWCVTHAAVANVYYDPACDPATSPTGFCQPPLMPGTPDVSWGAEAFLDTMMVNGTAYPTATLQPKTYRLRVLNASHDRFLNLQLYVAASKLGNTTPGAGAPTFTDAVSNLTEVAMISASARPLCTATFTADCVCDPSTGNSPLNCIPANWPSDGREGGAPDPYTSGPAMIQIGSEGGFLPAPVLLTNQPVQWIQDPTLFNVGNVMQQNEGGGTLFLGPAERADIIVDFTNFAGKTLILYNDAPTAFPALVPQYDYYTGAPDRTDVGGYTSVQPGVGPNIRTVMQIVVSGATGSAPINDYNPATLAALEAAFASTPTTPGVFAASQEPIVVGQNAYGTGAGNTSAYNVDFPSYGQYWGISNIFSTSLSFWKADGTLVNNYPMLPKAIHDEMGGTFDDYGRMSAKLGLEVLNSNVALSTFAMQTYVDPATEFVYPGQTQLWKITHNGVDSHPIHFHLFDVQVVNRVAWDGFMRLPDANEMGWKDTVRISPLEDTIVAFRPVTPRVPFALPNSIRPLNPTQPLGSTMGFGQIDPLTGAALEPLQTNTIANFGHEYVWHCHILSHEENDMMRAIVFNLNAQTELLWRNSSTGDNTIWYMDGTTMRAYDTLPAIADTNWQIVGRGDFNADAKPDILWRNTSTGDNVVWYMDGKTRTGYDMLTPITDQNWQIGGTGDFNNDGKTDILWRNSATGDNLVWFMNGISLTSYLAFNPIADLNWQIAGTGDFNNDGKPDIFWRNTATGDNLVWYMDGITMTSYAMLPSLADLNWQIVGTGDLNGDVNRDILWWNTTTGATMVWFMNGTTQIGSGSITPAINDPNWKIVGR